MSQTTPVVITRAPILGARSTLAASTFLAQLGIELVHVPAGEFVMGSDGKVASAVEEPEQRPGLTLLFALGEEPTGWSLGSGERPERPAPSLLERERPARIVYLADYCISRYPITRGQYLVFARDTRRCPPPSAEDDAHLDPDLPVCFVGWEEAAAFCRWLQDRTGLPVTLPTEAQWEKAARGVDGRTYPWGEAPPTPQLCNFDGQRGAPSPIGSHPMGASPWGCQDMAGNVWEWCADWFDPRWYYQAPDRDPAGPPGGINRVIRGGAFDSPATHLRCAARYYDRPQGTPFFPCGFRPVVKV